ncbi:Imm43 family immunity protein [Tabrizicola sp.]|uniref:Imm43 family immunity protein n=1 Tax=Tabrizicola sp. TaxID=2005166 RepID=UPI003F2C4CD5
MTYHILTYSGDYDRRVPPFIEGGLTLSPVKNISEIDHQAHRKFFNDDERKAVFPEPLWFISKSKSINLDYYPFNPGFLASERFVNLLQSYVPDNLRVQSITMLSNKGQSNTTHQMFFCQIINSVTVCDLTKMDIDGAYHPELDSPNRVEYQDGQPRLICALRLVLKPSLAPISLAHDIPLWANVLIVSQEVRDRMSAEDIMGARFVSTDDVMVVDFIPNGPGSFSILGPSWRERADLDRWKNHGYWPVDRKTMFDPKRAPVHPLIAEMLKKSQSS